MKREKKYIIIIVLGLAVLLGSIAFIQLSGGTSRDLPQESHKEKSDEIPSDYIAVFHGCSSSCNF